VEQLELLLDAEAEGRALAEVELQTGHHSVASPRWRESLGLVFISTFTTLVEMNTKGRE
jgi:hypothetical protein